MHTRNSLGVVTAIAYSELYGKEVRYCSDRKEEKDHGADKGSFLGSKLQDGDRVIMIEDVTTSGKSMEETVPKVKGAADVEIVGLMVSLDRMEVGKGGEKCALEEVKDLYGFETNAIVTMAEVVEHLYNKECNGKVVIDDEIKSAIDAYYEQYGAKSAGRLMNEKIYKTMTTVGAGNIVLGVIMIVTGIAAGVITIVGGARLLKNKSGLTF